MLYTRFYGNQCVILVKHFIDTSAQKRQISGNSSRKKSGERNNRYDICFSDDEDEEDEDEPFIGGGEEVSESEPSSRCQLAEISGLACLNLAV